MFRVYKRYKIVSTLIILNFICVFFALFNSLQSYTEIRDALNIQKQYDYSRRIEVGILLNNNSLDYEDIIKSLENVKGNIYFKNARIFFSNIDGTFVPEVILKQTEEIPVPSIGSITKLPRGEIIIADNITDKSKKIEVKGRTLKIFDIISTEKAPYSKGRIIMNGIDYFDIFPETLENQDEILLEFASNNNDLVKEYKKFKENLKKVSKKINVSYREIKNEVHPFDILMSSKYSIFLALLAFALINTVIVSQYWIVVRKREISIRKAFGCSDFMIIKNMSFEILQLLLLAAVISGLLQLVIYKRNIFTISLSSYVIAILSILMVLSITMFLSMIIPSYYVTKIHPADGVK
ncbi:FtsX-like permease family protein [Caloranaerobacter azorensis]|uniref:ABC transporter permease n=1 Tax=Caloranaerobacter azorensis TaxID=116090 RepID=A0A6P1Y9Z1_9FIRM|nr:ABC transporter permease [Caloranaerobacter azorensis]QIB25924.1 ABC transporter permease [Caloranaerobacter azorensis]